APGEAAAALEHAAEAGAHHAGHHPPDFLLPGAAVLVASAGILGAWKLYASGDFSAAKALRARFAPAVEALERRYYFDDVFLWLVDLSDGLAKALFWVDANIIDAIFVDGWAAFTRALAAVHDWVDRNLVDGAVDGVGLITADSGRGLRRLVRGQTQDYMLYAAVSVAVLAVIIITR
ncbi:MAG: putative NAD(P)H-quinone oxidoreductase chain 5, partial [Elusimicrobia bacterium]